MGKRKQQDKNYMTITFSGGPLDGQTMDVMKNPPPRLRLAFPEWCNYYRKGSSIIYEYDMDREWVSYNALNDI